MRPIVIMTDAPESGTRLARNVGGETVVWDLYETAPTVTDARLVIADLCSPDSSSIDRLKRALTKVRQPDTALLYLIHGNLERGKIQATMLGATRTLPASMAANLLTKTVAILSPSTAVAEEPAPRAQVQMAHRAFASIFLPQTPEMEAVEAGTELVERAIQDMKVREWLALVAEFDDVTHRHCMTVAGLAAAFAQSLGLNAADSHVVTKGALLHDIGKAKVPAAILNKPGPLDASEWREMCQHPTYGFDLLNEGNFSKKTLAVVRSHHEMLDGSGYPDGLKGSQISDLVRLITVCDIFAALIERRPYKEPKSAKVAYGILSEMKDKLDQDLVRVFAPVAFATEE